MVVVSDGDVTGRVRLGAFQPLAGISEYIGGVTTSPTQHWVPRYAALPLDAFRSDQGDAVDPTRVDSIRLEMDAVWPAGRMVLDDLRLRGDA